MSIDERKAIRRDEADRERAARPQRSRGQEAAPIVEAMQAYWAEGRRDFVLPAARAGRGVRPAYAELLGDDLVRMDLSLSDGVDTRRQDWGVQDDAQRLFAELLGADEVLLSTEGCTMCVHAALLATCADGDVAVIDRGSHKSVFTGLVLAGASPVYVEPAWDEELECSHGVEPSELARVLDATPAARVVLLTSPSYYGASADLPALVEVAHARGLPVIVDGAWGLDLELSDALPTGAVAAGADLAVLSTQKSASALAQTGVLAVQGDRVDPARLTMAWEQLETTSVSAPLLASIDACRRQFAGEGAALVDRSLGLAARLRRGLAGVEGLDLTDPAAVTGRPGVAWLDPRHLLFDVTGLGVTGFQAADELRRRSGLFFQIADHRRLMVLVSFADEEEGIDMLVAELSAWAAEVREEGRPTSGPARLPGPGAFRGEAVVDPRRAVHGRGQRTVPWREAAGEVAAELVTPYPPGIPFLAPGERITEGAVAHLEELVASGGFVVGAVDTGLDTFRVVA